MMTTTRRAVGGMALAGLLLGAAGAGARPAKSGRFGQVNRLRAKPGQADRLRAELVLMAAALAAASRYEVLRDERDPDTFWTVELWPSRIAHDRAVRAPAIRAGIDRCRLLVAAFENVATFNPAPADRTR